MVTSSAPPTPTSPFPSSGAVQPSSLSRLTLSDKLLLSQAVHHIGTSPPDWGRVSSILLSHPLIRTKGRLEQASKAGITLGRVFGSRECERAWVALMRQYSLVLQPGEKEYVNESEGESSSSSSLANRAKEARGLPPKTDRGSQLALAQFLYAERIREIQDSIKVKEQLFKSLVADIDALKSGALDEKLSAEVTTLNTQMTTLAVEPIVRPPPKDRTGGSANATATPGDSRATRVSRSGSSAALPSASLDGDSETEAGEGATRQGNDVAFDGDSMMEDAQVQSDGDGERKDGDTATGEVASKGQADEDNDWTADAEPATENAREENGEDELEETSREHEEEERAAEAVAEASAKQTRSKRKRGSDAGSRADEPKKLAEHGGSDDEDGGRKDRPDEGKKRGVVEGDEDTGGDDDVEDEDEGEKGGRRRQQRPEPRRSRRSGRAIGVEEDSQPPTPVSAVASATKNRLGSLRSRETTGTSVEGEEEDGGEVDQSRSTIEVGSRTSISPSSGRRGRGTSRLSSRRRSRGGSNTSRNEAELSEAEREKAKRKNEKVLLMLLNEVSNHTHGNLFHSAIKEQDAPDYYALVRHPLDLKTIKARIRDGAIVNSIQLRRALNQMFANSLIYNRPGTEIHRMALEMRDAAEEMIDRFEQTQLSASYARR